jgi:hypothetical protein
MCAPRVLLSKESLQNLNIHKLPKIIKIIKIKEKALKSLSTKFYLA